MAALRADFTLPLRSFELELALDVGDTVALVGPSGAGKTSVLRAVAGLVRPLARHDRARRRRVARLRAQSLPEARRASGRARLSGVRALPSHDRPPERRLCRAASAPTNISSGSVSPISPMPARRRCRAASASASPWRGRSRGNPGRSCSTSRCPRSTRIRRTPCAPSCRSCFAGSGCRRSSSRTTTRTLPLSRARWACWSTASSASSRPPTSSSTIPPTRSSPRSPAPTCCAGRPAASTTS